jgi:hypothetical protein
LDVRLALLATIKVNACCVLSANTRHELAVQSVKIVELEDTVTGVKNVKLVNTAPLRRTILRPVLHAELGGINLTLDKQAVFHAHLENTNMSKENIHV